MRLKKWNQAWKTRLIQEKNPGVDHCNARWIPAFAGMTGRFRGNDGETFAGMVGTHDCVVIDLSLSFPRRRESIKARQS